MGIGGSDIGQTKARLQGPHACRIDPYSWTLASLEVVLGPMVQMAMEVIGQQDATT